MTYSKKDKISADMDQAAIDVLQSANYVRRADYRHAYKNLRAVSGRMFKIISAIETQRLAAKSAKRGKKKATKRRRR